MTNAAEPILPVSFFTNLRANKPQTVVTYGTSLTEGGAWVPMLQPWFDNRYKGLVTVINSGKSGQHSEWGLANVQKQVVEHHPNLVFIEFGINDAVLRFNITPEKARTNLDNIIKAIRSDNSNADIVLMTMNAALDVNDKTAGSTRPKLPEYYANYTACAAETTLSLVDNYPAWLKLSQDDPTTFFSYAADGLHPNKTGIIAITWPKIENLLTAAEVAAKR